MPLTPGTLAPLLRTNILSKPNIGGLDNAAMTELCQAIEESIIPWLIANAVILPTALLAPPGTAGGPVTGTAQIT